MERVKNEQEKVTRNKLVLILNKTVLDYFGLLFMQSNSVKFNSRIFFGFL